MSAQLGKCGVRKTGKTGELPCTAKKDCARPIFIVDHRVY